MLPTSVNVSWWLVFSVISFSFFLEWKGSCDVGHRGWSIEYWFLGLLSKELAGVVMDRCSDLSVSLHRLREFRATHPAAPLYTRWLSGCPATYWSLLECAPSPSISFPITHTPTITAFFHLPLCYGLICFLGFFFLHLSFVDGRIPKWGLALPYQEGKTSLTQTAEIQRWWSPMCCQMDQPWDACCKFELFDTRKNDHFSAYRCKMNRKHRQKCDFSYFTAPRIKLLWSMQCQWRMSAPTTPFKYLRHVARPLTLWVDRQHTPQKDLNSQNSITLFPLPDCETAQKDSDPGHHQAKSGRVPFQPAGIWRSQETAPLFGR